MRPICRAPLRSGRHLLPISTDLRYDPLRLGWTRQPHPPVRELIGAPNAHAVSRILGDGLVSAARSGP